jgi:two-component system, NtrC family, sensor kinase
MRLTFKLTLAVSCVMLLVLGTMATLAWRREVELFDRDMRRDAEVLGGALAHVARREWARAGEAGARELVRQAASVPGVRVRWVDRDLGGHAIWAVRDQHARPDGVLLTYVALTGPHGEPAALELRESLAGERAYVRESLRRTALGTLLLFLLVASLLAILGAYFIGRPVAALARKARQVGAGDLETPLHLRHRDELGHLADEMNVMGTRLAREIRARQAATEQLRHADRLATVGRLASGLAHELGTPLNVVAGRARLLADRDVEGDEAIESARVIEGQAQRMTRLIQELLGFARPRAPERVSMDVKPLAERTVVLLASMASKAGVGVDASALSPQRVSADVSQLEQVLTNLLVNALQATRAGGQVSVGSERAHATAPADRGGESGEWVRLWVRDTGQGMDAATRERIFEPFFTTKDVGQGTGLGLSVSYGIVREHGGWIDVASAPGQGSTFSVYLPVSA